MNSTTRQLYNELVKEYHVKGLKSILLSPRSRKYDKGYSTCSTCFSGIKPHITEKNPPKYSIANGFVIGSFPKEIQVRNKSGFQLKKVIKEEELTDLLKAMVAPIRPYRYIFAYSGGAQKSLQGSYNF